MREDTLHDIDTFLRRGLIDDQRGVDPDIGVITHYDQHPFQAFLEYQSVTLLVELLFGAAILDQLEHYKKSAPAHISPEGKFIFRAHEFVAPEPPHSRRLF